MPTGLVLSGGGARGAFQVGVWKVLHEDRRAFDGALPSVISGTSAGALNGALIAAGLTPEQILDFWLDIADRPPIRANEDFFRSLWATIARILVREPLRGLKRRRREFRILGGLLRKHRWHRTSGQYALALEFLLTARFDNFSEILDGITTTHLFQTDPFKQRLAKALGSNRLPQTQVRLAINTVNAATGEVVRIVNHPPFKRPQATIKHYRYEPTLSLDMLVASASIPLLFNPVSIQGDTLWDGGLLVNSPMAPVVALGAKRIVPVLVTVKGTPDRGLHSFGNALERLVDTLLENAYTIDRKLLLARNELADRWTEEGLTRVELLKPIRPCSSSLFNAGSYLYFERNTLISMYEAGQRAAQRWLADGLRVDAKARRAPPPSPPGDLAR
ncbi:MAG: patatin-like phospholipase family protein [Nannocystaceae bacterium]